MTASILQNRVLVLNKCWQPISVTTVFDAVSKALQGTALFIEPKTFEVHDFDSWIMDWEDAAAYAKVHEVDYIRCSRFHIPVPEIMLCTSYRGLGLDMRPNRPKFSRRNVYLRDLNTCQYCGKMGKTNEMNLDHVTPKSRGGPMSWKNIVLSCIPCNDKKSNRTPAEAGMRLVRKPFVPSAKDLSQSFNAQVMRKVGNDMPKNWESFLGKMYWDVELK